MKVLTKTFGSDSDNGIQDECCHSCIQLFFFEL